MKPEELLSTVGFTQSQVDALLDLFTLKVKKKSAVADTAPVWTAYAQGYECRYRVAPVRNAAVNRQVVELVKRLGKDAAEVVRFYLTHNDSFYVKNCHPVSLCLKDAESLRTQWATGRKVTQREARQAESQDHFKGQMDRVKRGEV